MGGVPEREEERKKTVPSIRKKTVKFDVVFRGKEGSVPNVFVTRSEAMERSSHVRAMSGGDIATKHKRTRLRSASTVRTSAAKPTRRAKHEYKDGVAMASKSKSQGDAAMNNPGPLHYVRKAFNQHAPGGTSPTSQAGVPHSLKQNHRVDEESTSLQNFARAFESNNVDAAMLETENAKMVLNKVTLLESKLRSVLRTITLLEQKDQELRAQTKELVSELQQATEVLDDKSIEHNLHGSKDLILEGKLASVSSSSDDAMDPKSDFELVEIGPSAVDEPSSTECLVQHPGVLCCTRTHVKKDMENMSAILRMKVAVRCAGLPSGNANSVNLDGAIALASQAMAERASKFSQKKVCDARRGSPAWEKAHRELHDVLMTGKIVSSRPNDLHVSAYGHESFLVEVECRKTGRRVQTLFKPRVEGDAKGWHRAPVEWVAYELNKLLGMDYVPPVAYRTGGLDIAHRYFEEGAFLFFCKNARPLNTVPTLQWGVGQERLLSDTRILDVLLQNSDRHPGHFLLAEHWVKGHRDGALGTGRGKLCPVLIDHAAGFRKDAFVSMTHENAFQTGPVRQVSSSTYLKLRFLDAHAIAKTFSGYLSEAEMRALLQRRNSILEYLDDLVEKQGYDATVLD